MRNLINKDLKNITKIQLTRIKHDQWIKLMNEDINIYDKNDYKRKAYYERIESKTRDLFY